jgi:hypothetical protein
VTNAWLTMALWPVRPLGRQGGEVDRGSKGAKGEVRLAKGSPFHPTHPGLVRCNDFKDASKAAPLLPHLSCATFGLSGRAISGVGLKSQGVA